MLVSTIVALLVTAPRVYAAYELTCVAQRDGRPQCVGNPSQVELVTKLKVGRPLAYGVSRTDACGIDSTATLQCNSGRTVSNVAAMRINSQKLWWQTRDNKVCAGDMGSVNAGCSEAAMKGTLVYGDDEYAYLTDGTLCSASALLKKDSGACGKDDRFKGVRAMTDHCAIDGMNQGWCKTDPQTDDWTRVAMLDNSVGLVQAGTKVCAWADHGPLRCFDPARDTKAEPVATLDCVTFAIAGSAHVCAETCGDGEIRCMGANTSGVLGAPVTRDRAEVKGINAKSVVAGARHVCAIANDNAVSCWGENDKGQLGKPFAQQRLSSKPLKVNVPHLTSISASEDATCGISDDEHLWCWGGVHGEPHSIEALQNVTAAGVGSSQTCAIAAGKLQCWSGSEKPALMAGVADAVAVDMASNAGCALRKSGAVSCWTATNKRPTPVAGVKDAALITVDDKGGCAKRKTGSIDCWQHGKKAAPLANGVGASSIKKVAGGQTHCMVRDDGKVGCWGSELHPIFKALKPNGVTGFAPLAGVVDLAPGPTFACAIARDGIVGCLAPSGAVLGAGDLQYADTPVRFDLPAK